MTQGLGLALEAVAGGPSLESCSKSPACNKELTELCHGAQITKEGKCAQLVRRSPGEDIPKGSAPEFCLPPWSSPNPGKIHQVTVSSLPCLGGEFKETLCLSKEIGYAFR